MSVREIPDGIYQSAELVTRFKNILFGMNKQSEKVFSKQNQEKKTVFPYNELHPSSPFSNLIDWDEIIERVENRGNTIPGL